MLFRSNKYRPNILIIAPSYLGLFSINKIKNENKISNLKIIALLNTLTDQKALNGYDSTISIFDTFETIKDRLVTITDQHLNDVDSKQELSNREKEIVVCIVKGMTNKQMADVLCLSTHTIMAHRRNISNKLQIHSSAGLTIYAIVNKLVEIEDIKNSIQNEE